MGCRKLPAFILPWFSGAVHAATHLPSTLLVSRFLFFFLPVSRRCLFTGSAALRIIQRGRSISLQQPDMQGGPSRIQRTPGQKSTLTASAERFKAVPPLRRTRAACFRTLTVSRPALPLTASRMSLQKLASKLRSCPSASSELPLRSPSPFPSTDFKTLSGLPPLAQEGAYRHEQLPQPIPGLSGSPSPASRAVLTTGCPGTGLPLGGERGGAGRFCV